MDEILIVNNRVIKDDPMKILNDIRMQLTNGKLSRFEISGDNIKVTCPFHSDGHEHHPSAYLNLKNNNAPYLWFHCFTDGMSCPFEKFVGACFDRSESWGARWLLSNYSSEEENDTLYIKEIKLDDSRNEEKFLDESVLDQFANYHPYMSQRKLSKDICEKFQVKYDPKTRCLVFPVRDISGRLKFLTRRSIEGKKFIIDKNANKKDVYLLDKVIDGNFNEVYVVESQINALTL